MGATVETDTAFRGDGMDAQPRREDGEINFLGDLARGSQRLVLNDKIANDRRKEDIWRRNPTG
jgi:hypothetical protein